MKHKIGDFLWTWGHRIDGYYGASDRIERKLCKELYGMKNPDMNYGIPGKIYTSPFMGARALGVPNIVMTDKPPCEREAREIRALRRVVWSVWLEKNFDFSNDLEAVIKLQRKYKNIEGIILDDFSSSEVARGATVAVLKKLRYVLQTTSVPPLSVWATVYSMNLDSRVLRECLNYFDVLYFCVWDARDIPALEKHMQKYERLGGGRPIVFGLYMWDYVGRQELSVDLMKFQCATALRWLREKRIAGLVFMPSGLAEKDFAAVQYTRDWIREIKHQPAW